MDTAPEAVHVVVGNVLLFASEWISVGDVEIVELAAEVERPASEAIRVRMSPGIAFATEFDVVDGLRLVGLDLAIVEVAVVAQFVFVLANDTAVVQPRVVFNATVFVWSVRVAVRMLSWMMVSAAAQIDVTGSDQLKQHEECELESES